MKPPALVGHETARLANRRGERRLLELIQFGAVPSSSGNSRVLNENGGNDLRLQTGAHAKGCETAVRRHAGQGVNEIGSRLPGQQGRGAQLIIPGDAAADLVQRRDFAGQLSGKREHINGVRAGDRSGEGFIGRQAKGGFDKAWRGGEFFRAEFGAQRAR